MAEFGIEREVAIEAPVDVVWRTITEPDQITRWFADRVELELKPGGRGYLGFGHTATNGGAWWWRPWNRPAGSRLGGTAPRMRTRGRRTQFWSSSPFRPRSGAHPPACRREGCGAHLVGRRQAELHRRHNGGWAPS